VPDLHLAVLTSGGDAPGMNAAVRAVVRTADHHGIAVSTVQEGYEGLIQGGSLISRVTSDDVGGILHRGGTVIGSARSPAFLERDGRRRAAGNLAERGINALVVIGGDGSLTGSLFRQEWPDLLDELVSRGELTPAAAAAAPRLQVVGLVGSIDNDMFGTDMTIGADTALHRITEAIDAIHATAASHQRTFVVEVMGRNCGYLALMGGLATGANWVLIPENPPDTHDWRTAMCDALAEGRSSGRRQSLVVVAEGARDRDGNRITSAEVKDALEQQLGEDTRITILGHIQRGGSPSAFDRHLGTVCGHAAVIHLREADPDEEPQLIGIREHEVVATPLMECVERTHAVAERLAAHDFAGAMRLRGRSFAGAFVTHQTLVRAEASPPRDRAGRVFGILHAGGPAPGMNTAVRVASRLFMDAGHQVLGIRNGFEGLLDNDVETFKWMTASGWASLGGAELGTRRLQPTGDEWDVILDRIAEHRIDGLLMIGGWSGYRAGHTLDRLLTEGGRAVPIVCLPATINNDLPASDLAIGSDTALNSIVSDVDKIKQSAVASRRCFVVEVMGHDCGYLALQSGLASGAERIYLPEDGITLAQLQQDIASLRRDFASGKRLGLIIRSEFADGTYTTQFVTDLLEKEGGELFDVRSAILGHVQQGGSPSPFDRIQSTRLADQAVRHLLEQVEADAPTSAMLGLVGGRMTFTDLRAYPTLIAPDAQRTLSQPWLALRDLATVMSGRTGDALPA